MTTPHVIKFHFSHMFGFLYLYALISFFNTQFLRIRGKGKSILLPRVSHAIRKPYRMSLWKFNFFYTQARRRAIPTLENTSLLFATYIRSYLAGQNLSSHIDHPSISVSSSVCNSHVAKLQHNYVVQESVKQ